MKKIKEAIWLLWVLAWGECKGWSEEIFEKEL